MTSMRTTLVHRCNPMLICTAIACSLLSGPLIGCGEEESSRKQGGMTGEDADASNDSLPIMFDAPGFELTNQEGETFSSESLAGHVWVADFIFTRCPGPCPVMTQNMKKLHDTFDDAEKLRFVTFTVDPENDTPAVLKKYARRFKADSERWTFLTGERETIFGLSVDGFKLAAAPAEAADDPSHPIVHSQRYVLVDREGKIRGYYNGLETADLQSIERDLRSLLGES